MATITGTLRDFAVETLANYSPRLIFTPSSVALSAGRLYATKPVIVVPEYNGDFEVTLVASDEVFPAIVYSIRIEWLDSDGGFVGTDLVGWSLTVPSAGGTIGDLVEAPSNPAQAWVALEPPPEPITPGTWWLQVNANDPHDPRNTGLLSEWR